MFINNIIMLLYYCYFYKFQVKIGWIKKIYNKYAVKWLIAINRI